MTKRIIYIVINLTIAVALFLFIQMTDPHSTLPLIVVACGLIFLLLILFQIILLIAYAMKSKKNFDFLFVFTCIYSIIFIVIYAGAVKQLIDLRRTLNSMQFEVSKELGHEGADVLFPIQNQNPFWGMHTICLIPFALQLILLIVRLKRAKINKSNIA